MNGRIEHKKPRVNNSYIMAPKESFNLQEKPKDPLLFYKINDEYFYLIHKWGDDLSLFRRLKSTLSHRGAFFFCWVAILFICVFAFIAMPSLVYVVIGLLSFVSILVSGILWACGDPVMLSKENNWDSKYID